MPGARLIICEKTPRWALALRAADEESSLPLVETRSLTQCAAALVESPASIVLIEISEANFEAALALINRVRERPPLAHVIAAIAPESIAATGLLQEAGAILVVTSTLEAAQAVALARRHFGQCPNDEGLDLRAWVAQRMPWAAYATQKK